MRIRVRPSRRPISRVTLNLASMIDVVFLLLIYFMVTMIIATPEDRLHPALQAQTRDAAGSRSDFQPQIVTVAVIDNRPAYRLGGRVFFDTASLREALEPLSKSAGLFVRVEREPSAGFVIGAIQAGYDAGFDQVTYVVPQ